MEKPNLLLDGWRVSPEEGTLRRDTTTVHLEPRVMELLVYLATHAGEVVTRESLERDVWRGAVVGYDAVTSSIIKLRKALGDDARQPRVIVTVPKKGYQLVAPVEYLDPASTDPAVASARDTTPDTRKHRLQAAFAVVAILIVATLAAWRALQPPEGQPAVPAILVLPFEDMDPGGEHDAFVDGITEDVVTDLSRLAGLFVLSSNATFKYKNQAPTIQAVREELGIDFVVQGSVRRQGQSVRINAQLVNAETGFNVWARRYDATLENVFAVQDEITSRLIEALAVRLTSTEQQRLAQRMTNSLGAYDFFLEGQRASRQGSRQANRLAAEYYRSAIEQDPAYGRAYGALGFTLAVDFRRGWTDTPVETLDRALALAEQGVALDDSIPHTYWSLGFVHLMRREFAKAEQAAATSIRIAPNYADGYGLLALIKNNLGEPEQAIGFVEKGMAINPYFTWDYLFNLGWAHYMLGNQEAAIDALEKAQQRNESIVPIKLILAASYVQAGRADDAEWTVEQLLLLNPASTLSHTDNAMPVAKRALKQRLLNDLRRAGLPE